MTHFYTVTRDGGTVVPKRGAGVVETDDHCTICGEELGDQFLRAEQYEPFGDFHIRKSRSRSTRGVARVEVMHTDCWEAA